MCPRFLSALKLLITLSLLAGCSNGGERPKDEEHVATPGRAAPSPSKRFLLRVVEGRGEHQHSNSFEVFEADGPNPEKAVFASGDWFSARHTTYFLWDGGDRVWVYSGDVGTFYWTRESDGRWKKHNYAEEKIEVPPYLKRKRPEFFP